MQCTRGLPRPTYFAHPPQHSHGTRKERRASALPSVRLSGERHYTALHLTSRRPYMCLRRGLLLVNSYEGPRRVVIPQRTPNYEHHHDRLWRFARSRLCLVSIRCYFRRMHLLIKTHYRAVIINRHGKDKYNRNLTQSHAFIIGTSLYRR